MPLRLPPSLLAMRWARYGRLLANICIVILPGLISLRPHGHNELAGMQAFQHRHKVVVVVLALPMHSWTYNAERYGALLMF